MGPAALTLLMSDAGVGMSEFGVPGVTPTSATGAAFWAGRPPPADVLLVMNASMKSAPV
jgi:hypothetical protein